jgi:hypothetical protein
MTMSQKCEIIDCKNPPNRYTITINLDSLAGKEDVSLCEPHWNEFISGDLLRADVRFWWELAFARIAKHRRR